MRYVFLPALGEIYAQAADIDSGLLELIREYGAIATLMLLTGLWLRGKIHSEGSVQAMIAEVRTGYENALLERELRLQDVRQERDAFRDIVFNTVPMLEKIPDLLKKLASS